MKNRDLEGYEIAVAGWNSAGRSNFILCQFIKIIKIKPFSTEESAVKMVSHVTGRSKETCQACLSSLSARVTITDKQFCAGLAGVDACSGFPHFCYLISCVS